MSFLDIIKKSVIEEFSSTLSTGDLFFSLLTAFVAALLITYVYKKTYTGVSYTKSFVLSKNWANFKYVYVGIACKSDIGYLWKGGLIIPTEMIKIASGNYQVSCIYDLTDFYVNAEVDFSNANHINSRITSHGSDAGFSNARIYVFGLEEP